MKKLFPLLLFFLSSPLLKAQQDPLFTQYMFNQLLINPAFAGSEDHLTLNFIHRQQWLTMQGGPMTQSVTAHSPLKNQNSALGLSLYNDRIGPSNTFMADFSYAYRLQIGESSRLNLGVQAGVGNWAANFTDLVLQDPTDPSFNDPGEKQSAMLLNFGLGAYFKSKSFYLGLSAPRMLNSTLRQEESENIDHARLYRHFYLTTGGTINIGTSTKFKPNLAIRHVGFMNSKNMGGDTYKIGAPTSFDINATFMFVDALWAGLSFRSAIEGFSGGSSYDSIDLLLGYKMKNGLSLGTAFDYPLTELQGPASGSFEVMLGYEFYYFVDRVEPLLDF